MTYSKLIASLFFILFSHSIFSQPILVLNSGFNSPISNESQTGFVDQILIEAFRRIGYQLKTARLPAERALINANRGIDDGDILRIAGLQKKYTNLIQVPEPVMKIDMVLFSRNYSDLVVTGWKSMQSHSLAIISGWKLMEINFGKLSDSIEIIKTDSAEQSFTMLLKNRVDFVAYSTWSGLDYLKKYNIHDIVLLKPPLASPEAFVYLHKKHKKLVPKLAAAIRAIKADGTFQTLFSQILLPYLQK